MASINVTPQMLIDAAHMATARAVEIDATLVALGAQIQALTTDWQGAAQIQFFALYEQWQVSARSLNEALNGMGRLLDAAGVAYEEGESRIARMFMPT